MKWVWGVLVLAAACGPVAAEPVEQASEVAVEVEPSEDVNVAAFHIQLEGTALLESQGSQRLEAMGWRICGELDDGDGFQAVLESLVNESRLGDDAGLLVGASVNHLCPQWRDAAAEFAAR